MAESIKAPSPLFGPARRLPFVLRFVVTRMLLFAKYVVEGDRSRAKAILDGMFGS